MQIDFRLPREWAQANESVLQALQANVSLTPNSTATRLEPRLFQNMSAAVVETVYGLSQLYPMKKKVFFIKNTNPLFDAAVLPLAKMGYIVTGLETSVLERPDDFAAIVDRECLLVLYAVDDPILGRAYDVTRLEAALKEKVIVQVRLSHNAHFYKHYEADDTAVMTDTALPSGAGRDIPRLGAFIYSLKPEGALVLCGERARFGVLVADQLTPPLGSDLSWLTTPRVAHQEKILDFESRRVAGAHPIFESTALRVFDRAAISWSDLDGYALITRLAERLKIILNKPGHETRLEATSLSRWGGVRTMDFLKNQNLSPETIRGLVLIDATLLSPTFERHLVEARESLLTDQFGGAKWSTPIA